MSNYSKIIPILFFFEKKIFGWQDLKIFNVDIDFKSLMKKEKRGGNKNIKKKKEKGHR